jgi:hypothetical protein
MRLRRRLPAGRNAQVGNDGLVCIKTSPSLATSPRCSRNAQSRSRLSTAFRLALTECSGIFNRCGQVESWRAQQLPAAAARLTIYRAFIEGDLEVPRHLARRVHERYFNPRHEEFQPRTMWSLSNAFTSAFKELDPIPQFRATAKLGSFFEAVRPAV